jgi:hypothetical protein
MVVIAESHKRKEWGQAGMQGQEQRSEVEMGLLLMSEPREPLIGTWRILLSWEETFGNFNLTRFGEGGLCAPPPKVKPVKRLKADLKAFHKLADFEEPPRRKARLGKSARAIYGFGDASKDGFGASIDIDGKGVVWRSGVWNLSIREELSNFREFRNLQWKALRILLHLGIYEDTNCICLLITRRLSPPFSKERLRARSYLILFSHPNAAAAACEWLGHQSIHKRPNSTHLVLVPRLMMAMWRKRLSKTSDLLFTVPIGTKVWGVENHEPLICALCLPLSRSFPWSHRGTARVAACKRKLSSLWKEDFDAAGNILRQLLGKARSLGKV